MEGELCWIWNKQDIIPTREYAILQIIGNSISLKYLYTLFILLDSSIADHPWIEYFVKTDESFSGLNCEGQHEQADAFFNNSQ